MFHEFKKFVMRGNAFDMAVGIIIGASFGGVVKSLVDDVLMPPLGLLIGGIDFVNFFAVLKQGTTPGPYVTLADAKAAGAVTVNYGVFVNGMISFLIVGFAVFLLVRGIHAIRAREEAAPVPPTTKECQYCATTIPIKATRCPQCTSGLAA